MSTEDDAALVAQAQAFAAPWLDAVLLRDGEPAWDHARGAASILRDSGAPIALEAAMYLSTVVTLDDDATQAIKSTFHAGIVSLVEGTRQLAMLERTARGTSGRSEGDGDRLPSSSDATRIERVRRMLLAFSRDLRGVLLHLASRLQTMRWFAAQGLPFPPAQARDALELLAPLANRLGLWSLKWELEDLAFHCLQPDAYAIVAGHLPETRAQRKQEVEQFRRRVTSSLAGAGVNADVQGRDKHLYSIWRKMQGKSLTIHTMFDLRAVRVIVVDVAACYAALAVVHERWSPLAGEYDDYIARPKSNGYQSLHTVVRDDDGRPIEVQIRTRAMHDHAEHGVAAHWAYKEAGSKGYAGASAAVADATRVSQSRKAMLHQLLAWEQDVVMHDKPSGDAGAAAGERVYVFTPQGAVIDLPATSTAVDFAYALHTSLGHRCRGGRIDGAMMPLNTALKNGQTVEVVVGKDGGPSMDWLNPELGYLGSPRSRAKVRAWFNVQAHGQTMARGRERLEKLLQRLGRTAVKHADVASRLQLPNVEMLYTELGKDERPLRDIEGLWEVASEPASDADHIALRASRHAVSDKAARSRGDVLVLGVDSLLTGLARCCRPAPPDAIGGFVTRTQGVAVHRARCTNFLHMARQAPQRVCDVAWGAANQTATVRYAVDVLIEAIDRPALLRDISEVFAKDRIHVSGVQMQTVRGARDRVAWMTFTVEVIDASTLGGVLSQISRVPGVRHARRK